MKAFFACSFDVVLKKAVKSNITADVRPSHLKNVNGVPPIRLYTQGAILDAQEHLSAPEARLKGLQTLPEPTTM